MESNEIQDIVDCFKQFAIEFKAIGDRYTKLPDNHKVRRKTENEVAKLVKAQTSLTPHLDMRFEVESGHRIKLDVAPKTQLGKEIAMAIQEGVHGAGVSCDIQR